MGLAGIVDGKTVLVGNIYLMDQFGVVVEKIQRSLCQDWALEGCTVILVAVDGEVRKLFIQIEFSRLKYFHSSNIFA